MKDMICGYIAKRVTNLQHDIKYHLSQCCMYPELRETFAHDVNNVRMSVCDLWLSIAEAIGCE